MKKLLILALLVGWVKITSAYLVYGVHSPIYFLTVDNLSKSTIFLLFSLFIWTSDRVMKAISIWCAVISLFHLYILLPVEYSSRVMIIGKPLFLLSALFFFVLTIYSIFVKKLK